MLIDLSMPVNEKTIVFPGDAAPVFEPTGAFAEHDVIDTVVHINVHLGTHIDAPVHMVKGGKPLSEYGADRFICDAICVDARNSQALTADLLAGMDIVPGMAVLFYAGTGDKYTEQTYAIDYPGIDQGLADELVKKKVSMVGVDMISFDHDAPFPIHKTLLGNDILLIENLINLGKVAGQRFKLYAMPVNWELEAAPARVVAEL
ncbi:MAG TPA: cyclase family protein [Candidatus Limnocylindria bacterium]|nr:cyclase family protein [Candidatus Limnocylindria bacterium]